MRKEAAAKVVTASEVSEMPLPAQIQEALGELVGAAREGLLALSVGVGLGVTPLSLSRPAAAAKLVARMARMEAEVDEVVGPKASGIGRAPLCATAMRTGR